MPSRDVAQRLAYADKVRRDKEVCLADEMAYDAVLRCLQCISEAAKKLGGWKGIRGTGTHLPPGTCLLISVLLSAVFWILGRL